MADDTSTQGIATMSWVSLALSRLPLSLSDPAMEASPSVDGRVYPVWRRSGWEHRVEGIGTTSPAEVANFLGRQCCLRCNRSSSAVRTGGGPYAGRHYHSRHVHLHVNLLDGRPNGSNLVGRPSGPIVRDLGGNDGSRIVCRVRCG